MKHVLGTVFLCGLVIGLFGGCSGGTSKGPTGNVSGTVTFDGQPVATGTVRLYSQKTGETGSGVLTEGGKFKFAEPLPVGSYQAIVVPPQEPPPEVGKAYEPKTYDNIPEKYRTELTTDITVEVKAGDNTITVEMKK